MPEAAADLQFQATVPGDEYCMVEFWTGSTTMDLLTTNPFALDNGGKINVSTGPGPCVELNNEFLASVAR